VKRAWRSALSTLLCGIGMVAPALAADPGITDTTITLGMSAPFHGPNCAYGLEMKEAISACFEQVNASGGVHGRSLKLVALDDGHVPERAARAVRRTCAGR